MRIQSLTAQSVVLRSAAPRNLRPTPGAVRKLPTIVPRDVSAPALSAAAICHRRGTLEGHGTGRFPVFPSNTTEGSTLNPLSKTTSPSSSAAPSTASLSAKLCKGSPEWPSTLERITRVPSRAHSFAIALRMSGSFSLYSRGRQSSRVSDRSLRMAISLSIKMRTEWPGLSATNAPASSARVLGTGPPPTRTPPLALSPS